MADVYIAKTDIEVSLLKFKETARPPRGRRNANWNKNETEGFDALAITFKNCLINRCVLKAIAYVYLAIGEIERMIKFSTGARKCILRFRIWAQVAQATNMCWKWLLGCSVTYRDFKQMYGKFEFFPQCYEKQWNSLFTSGFLCRWVTPCVYGGFWSRLEANWETLNDFQFSRSLSICLQTTPKPAIDTRSDHYTRSLR